jgi:hypothetical protein
MDKIQDLYLEAKKNPKYYYSLILLIEFLVYEKKVLQLSDSEDKLTYFMQDRFQNSMNKHLQDYERRRVYGVYGRKASETK